MTMYTKRQALDDAKRIWTDELLGGSLEKFDLVKILTKTPSMARMMLNAFGFDEIANVHWVGWQGMNLLGEVWARRYLAHGGELVQSKGHFYLKDFTPAQAENLHYINERAAHGKPLDIGRQVSTAQEWAMTRLALVEIDENGKVRAGRSDGDEIKGRWLRMNTDDSPDKYIHWYSRQCRMAYHLAQGKPELIDPLREKAPDDSPQWYWLINAAIAAGDMKLACLLRSIRKNDLATVAQVQGKYRLIKRENLDASDEKFYETCRGKLLEEHKARTMELFSKMNGAEAAAEMRKARVLPSEAAKMSVTKDDAVEEARSEMSEDEMYVTTIEIKEKPTDEAANEKGTLFEEEASA